MVGRRARNRAKILGAAALVAGMVAGGSVALGANESTADASTVGGLAGSAAAGAPYSCTTSKADGSCGPYAYQPQIGSASGGGT